MARKKTVKKARKTTKRRTVRKAAPKRRKVAKRTTKRTGLTAKQKAARAARRKRFAALVRKLKNVKLKY